MKQSISRPLVIASGLALAAGLVSIEAPASAAAKTTSFKAYCVAQAPVVGAQKRVVDHAVTVDAPATVDAGELFSYTIQPSAASYPDKDSGATTTSMSRIKFDYAIPTNATFVNAEIVAGTGIGLDMVAPGVLRVDESGNKSDTGTILRLSGGNQVIGNGPNSSTGSEGGIRAPKTKKNLDGTPSSNGDTWYRLPAVKVTMRAGDSGTVQPKVRTAGSAGSNANDANYNTQLALASFLGNKYAPTRCVPKNSESAALNDGAGPLATIQINSDDNGGGDNGGGDNGGGDNGGGDNGGGDNGGGGSLDFGSLGRS